MSHPVKSLADRSLGILELEGEFETLDFHRAVVGDEPSRLTIPSADSMLMEITISDTGMTAQTLCIIEAYHKFFSHTFQDCSSLHIDIETGVFSHYRNDTSKVDWSFPEYTPQIIPDQGMEINQGLVYTLNSSRHHDLGEVVDAKAYFREVRPVLRFRLNEPAASVRALGNFPHSYGEQTGSVEDYLPLFCVNNNFECVMSFRYTDSLYFADEDRVKAVSCKSEFYTSPDFLTFEEAKSMRAVRKFNSESSMYLWVKYNPIRDEYYRFCKHALDKDGKSAYSILVLNAEFNQTAEFTFNSEEYGLVPLVSTKEGFMVLNIRESKLKRKYCFEKFRV